MKAIQTVFERMRGWESHTAFYWKDCEYTYGDFLGRVDQWVVELGRQGLRAGGVCALYGDYSPGTCSLFFALMKMKAIAVPLTPAVDAEMDQFMEIAGVEMLIRFDAADQWTVETRKAGEPNHLIATFRLRDEPGLVVFTSGSTGQPKGILHNCERVMRKFAKERKGNRTLLFLMMDHFGGYNTLLGALAYGGVGICPTSRLPKEVSSLIEASRATLLPATPTFINLLLGSGVWRDHDLSSIRLISYGTEVMNEATLKKLEKAFPSATLKQTYGLSELGVLRSESRNDGTTWVKVGGAGFDIKVVDGLLFVKAESNMVGYLNAPDPFDKEGWMCTQDRVEIDGDYMRFMGRQSDIINVGGQKVFPVEVEDVLMEADNIREASVVGSPHPMLGQAVVATVILFEDEDREQLSNRLRDFCRERLTRFKIPMRFLIADAGELQSARFKKLRNVSPKAKTQPTGSRT